MLSIVKKNAKSTTGIDSLKYKNFLKKNGHEYFSNLEELIKNKKLYDLVFSLSELEHKFNPIQFLKNIRKILSKSGKIILRVPNYNNIYKYILGYYFDKFDYRTSHNYYFSKKNLEILFKKTKLKIEHFYGYHEYDLNHLLEYIVSKKRIGKKYNKHLSKYDNDFAIKNIERSLISTSLIYILSKNK